MWKFLCGVSVCSGPVGTRHLRACPLKSCGAEVSGGPGFVGGGRGGGCGRATSGPRAACRRETLCLSREALMMMDHALMLIDAPPYTKSGCTGALLVGMVWERWHCWACLLLHQCVGLTGMVGAVVDAAGCGCCRWAGREQRAGFGLVYVRAVAWW